MVAVVAAVVRIVVRAVVGAVVVAVVRDVESKRLQRYSISVKR